MAGVEHAAPVASLRVVNAAHAEYFDVLIVVLGFPESQPPITSGRNARPRPT